MEMYVGVKIVEAKPMLLGDYNKLRGWPMPEEEDPEKQGYFVVYPDGYKSWCPIEQFEEANRFASEMPFGYAVEVMKKGMKVARRGWNGSGMWVVIQKGYPNGIAINKNTAESTGIEEGTVMKFRPYFILFTAQEDFAHWNPSNSDILADDWYIVG